MRILTGPEQYVSFPCDVLAESTDWPQINLDEGLAEVIGWVEKNWEEIARQPLEYQHRP